MTLVIFFTLVFANIFFKIMRNNAPVIGSVTIKKLVTFGFLIPLPLTIF